MPAAAHSFSLTVIQFSVKAVLAGMSLRLVVWALHALGEWFGFEAPSFSTVRLWVLRVGLALWKRQAPAADDWIWIVDHVAQSDGGKCLVIVGVRQSHLIGRDFALAHTDVVLLYAEVMQTSTGDDMHLIFNELSDRIGVPRQIVSDHGSDALKGERLFQTEHPQTVLTWDITHRMARLLIGAIQGDERWAAFKSACQRTRLAVTRSRWSPLAPPSTKGASRCEHFDRLVLWAEKTLARLDAGAAAKITSEYMWDATASELVRGEIPSWASDRLDAELLDKPFAGESEFREAVGSLLGPGATEFTDRIVKMSDQSYRGFVEHFSWLESFRDILRDTYLPMVSMTYSAEKQVKHAGLHGWSARDWLSSQPKLPREQVAARRFRARVLQYLLREGENRSRDAALLATSDVLESLFGKYKHYTERGPDKVINSSILTLPLATEEITPELVEDALNTTPTKSFYSWVSSAIGKTRRAIQYMLGHPESDIKPA